MADSLKRLTPSALYPLADMLNMTLDANDQQVIRGEVVREVKAPTLGLTMKFNAVIVSSRIEWGDNYVFPERIAVVVHLRGSLYLVATQTYVPTADNPGPIVPDFDLIMLDSRKVLTDPGIKGRVTAMTGLFEKLDPAPIDEILESLRPHVLASAAREATVEGWVTPSRLAPQSQMELALPGD